MLSSTNTLVKVYNESASRAASQIIARYSSSFALATRLLSEPTRTDIRNLYAVVRIADEIVDGTALSAGGNPPALLDEYEQQVRSASRERFHTDPILQAFSNTARRCELEDAHLEAFFTSMRSDLDIKQHDDASLKDYVYGSAEVIGLLCLDIFLTDHPTSASEKQRLQTGAKSLGAAFQKINFLRDQNEDTEMLGREYFPPDSEGSKIIKEIEMDLKLAKEVIPSLPLTARAGVLTATGIFEELTRRLAQSGPTRERIRVSGAKKLAISIQAAGTALRRKQ